MRSILVVCFGLAGTLALSSIGARAQQLSAYNSVDTFIGTAGGGNTFPGATLPFGMVQWSPDTNHDAWYDYNEKSILGFSLTHISGAGCPLYGDFAVLPTLDELTTSPGKDFGPYAAAFEHSKEEAHPGYYAVTLDNGVRVEITVAERAGIARFTFPAGVPARLLVNAGSSAESLPPGSQDYNHNGITLNGSDSFSAFSRAGHFCSSDSHYKIYAVGKFNKPFVETTPRDQAQGEAAGGGGRSHISPGRDGAHAVSQHVMPGHIASGGDGDVPRLGTEGATAAIVQRVVVIVLHGQVAGDIAAGRNRDIAAGGGADAAQVRGDPVVRRVVLAKEVAVKIAARIHVSIQRGHADVPPLRVRIPLSPTAPVLLA